MLDTPNKYLSPSGLFSSASPQAGGNRTGERPREKISESLTKNKKCGKYER